MIGVAHDDEKFGTNKIRKTAMQAFHCFFFY
jgi:hypothetical protein